MMAGTKWTELLTRPSCRQSGPIHLSQPEGRAYDFSVEAVPAGFKVVRTEYGETFACSACDRHAITSYPGALYSSLRH
jgi:hypothetical protein